MLTSRELFKMIQNRNNWKRNRVHILEPQYRTNSQTLRYYRDKKMALDMTLRQRKGRTRLNKQIF